MAHTDAERGDPAPVQAYRDALARGSFRIQQCKDCGRHGFPPRESCTHCGAADLKWVEPTGRAKVVELPAGPPIAGAGSAPSLALVELEEGPRIHACIMGIDPAKVALGMHVSAHIGIVDGQPALVFYAMEQGSNEW